MRIPALLIPTTVERIRLPSGREEELPKATPLFTKWQGEFPWSTYGGKPILSLRGEPRHHQRHRNHQHDAPHKRYLLR